MLLFGLDHLCLKQQQQQQKQLSTITSLFVFQYINAKFNNQGCFVKGDRRRIVTLTLSLSTDNV